MAIKKEYLNKLSEKDRKEFKEEYEKCKIEVFPITLGLLYDFIKLFAFFLLIIPLYKIAFGYEIIITLTRFLFFALRIFMFAFIATIYMDLVLNIIIPMIKRKKLISEYFEVKAKDKK